MSLLLVHIKFHKTYVVLKTSNKIVIDGKIDLALEYANKSEDFIDIEGTKKQNIRQHLKCQTIKTIFISRHKRRPYLGQSKTKGYSYLL